MCAVCEIKQYETFEELPQDLKDKFKYNSEHQVGRAKKSYVNFINLLNKDGNELVSDYINSTEKVSIKWGECGHITQIKPIRYKNGRSCGLIECRSKHTSKTKTKDLTGQRFGRLTIVSLCEEQVGGYAKWNCLCDCGNMTTARSGDLKSGLKKSCGCLHHDTLVEKNMSNKQRQAVKKSWENNNGSRRQQIRQLGLDSKGESNPMWKGGITPITNHLRVFAKEWKKQTYVNAKYKCQLTGKQVHGGNSDVHHLYSFNSIVLDAHAVNNINIKPQVKDYTEEELHKLEEYVAEWHNNTSNGVLLCKEVHKLFHDLYGYGDNTPEQFEEFKQRYLNGEFNKDNTEVTCETKAS